MSRTSKVQVCNKGAGICQSNLMMVYIDVVWIVPGISAKRFDKDPSRVRQDGLAQKGGAKAGVASRASSIAGKNCSVANCIE
jgi:hypothetical protein